MNKQKKNKRFVELRKTGKIIIFNIHSFHAVATNCQLFLMEYYLDNNKDKYTAK